MKQNRSKGFSLVELMVVVVIVGILAAVAMPSYNNYLVRGSRAAAQTELLEMASLQEKIYLNSTNYTPNVDTAYNGNAAGGLGRTGGRTPDGKYTITLRDSAGVALAAPSQTYTLRATPVAGGRQAGDGCITIQENGQRQWHENNDACNSASPKSW